MSWELISIVRIYACIHTSVQLLFDIKSSGNKVCSSEFP